MRERTMLLNIVAELRGRLDELEALIRTAPNNAIMTPASYDEEGVIDLTPASYREFRAQGLAEPHLLRRYQAWLGFAQFGAPGGADDSAVEAAAFPLSDLHRLGPDPAFGLALRPRLATQPGFFTYEFLADAEGLAQYQWLEWVLKLSADRSANGFVQAILEGEGFSERIDLGQAAVSEFAAFRHIRLDRASLLNAAAGRRLRRIRLTLSFGANPPGLDLYALALYARI